MKEKYYNSTSSLIMGIILIVMAMVLFIGKGQFYIAVVNLVIFVFFLKLLMDCLQLVRNWKRIDLRNKLLFNGLFHLGTCFVFLVIPNLFYGLVPLLFSLYLCLIGISQFIMCWLEIRNGEFIQLSQFLVGMVCFLIAVPIFMNPVMKLDQFTNFMATYMLLLGGYYLFFFLLLVVPLRTKNSLKRRIRITLPKFIEAIIPYSMMVEINRNLSVRKTGSYAFEKMDTKGDLNILIHTSNRGFNRMGHMDIYFDGKVISYGNYDEGSRYFNQLFGDGVLFTTNNKTQYINFCIDHSKKTIFDFGISLTDRQKERIRNRIDELFANTVQWNYKDDKKYYDGDSYAAKLYKRTKAKFYKFKKGKYCTYYILGTNCCYLVDDILGKSGMDILSINGIITPGTYYDYLNRQLKLKNSNVVSKDIYNFDNKAK